MAHSKLMKSIAALTEETALKTVDDMASFLMTKMEFDDDIKNWFEEFKSHLKEETAKSSSKKSKKSDSDEKSSKKRGPSRYNIFLAKQMKAIKAENPDLKGKELMKAAVVEWNKLTEEEKKACPTSSEE